MNNRDIIEVIIKPWGKEELLEINDYYVVKRLTMKKGHRCSLQYHNEKKETIYVLSGMLTILLSNEIRSMESVKYIHLNPGEFITIDPGFIHRMEAMHGEDSIYLESSTIQLNDLVRIEDDYNRS